MTDLQMHPVWCTGRHPADGPHHSQWRITYKPSCSTITVHVRFYQPPQSPETFVQLRVNGLTDGADDDAGYGLLTGEHASELGYVLRAHGRQIRR